jgi:hypothetical protein
MTDRDLIAERSAPSDEKKPRQSRTITGAEVREWFKHHRKPWPSDVLCDEVAARLTKMRWSSDAPLPVLEDGMWWVKETPDSPWVQKPDDAADSGWDFQGATDAANNLLANAPAMLRHWDRLRWAPETRTGYEAIKTLQDALELALPYIEWPFGKYERQNPQKRLRPKDWHVRAHFIAHIIGNALIQSGHRAPGLAGNSIVVMIVREALIRIRCPDIDRGTIAQYLTRWAKKHGKMF